MEMLVNVFDGVVFILVWSVRVDCRGRVRRVRFFFKEFVYHPLLFLHRNGYLSVLPSTAFL